MAEDTSKVVRRTCSSRVSLVAASARKHMAPKRRLHTFRGVIRYCLLHFSYYFLGHEGSISPSHEVPGQLEMESLHCKRHSMTRCASILILFNAAAIEITKSNRARPVRYCRFARIYPYTFVPHQPSIPPSAKDMKLIPPSPVFLPHFPSFYARTGFPCTIPTQISDSTPSWSRFVSQGTNSNTEARGSGTGRVSSFLAFSVFHPISRRPGRVGPASYDWPTLRSRLSWVPPSSGKPCMCRVAFPRERRSSSDTPKVSIHL